MKDLKVLSACWLGGLVFLVAACRFLLPKWLRRQILSIKFLIMTLIKVKIHNAKYYKKNYSFADLFEKLVDSYPERVQLISVETKTAATLLQLDQLANRIAWWLLRLGVKPRDTVCLMMLNRIEFFAMTIACAKIGVSCALINSNLKGEPLLHSLKVSVASSISKIVIRDSEIDISESDENAIKSEGITIETRLINVQNSSASTKEYSRNESLLNQFSIERPGREIRKFVIESDPFLLIFTSGTTGHPKASKISHSKHYCASLPYGEMCQLTPKDRIYTTMPLYHSAAGVLGAAAAFRTGACMVFRKKFSSSNFASDCVEFNITSFQYIGEFCRYLLNTPESDIEKSLKIKNCFGNGLRADVWSKFQARFRIKHIIELYGSTEGNCALFNSTDTVGALGFIPRWLDWIYPVVIVKTNPNSPAEPLRNEKGFCDLAPIDAPGLLCSQVRNDRVDRRFDGYTDENATKKKILTNLFESGDQYFNTGDLIRRDKYGFFYWCDRLGDTFRWKCENVSTTQVEEIFSRCPDVEDVNVYGVEVPDADGRAGMAAIVVKGGTEVTSFNWSRLVELMEANLPVYARPLFIRFKDVLETTVTYKHIKTSLVKEGFDLDKCGKDPVYMYVMKEKRYQLLTRDILENIKNGKIQF